MYPFSAQFWSDMGLRLTGPAAMRFVIQPIMAILLGIRDGLQDARAGEAPYIFDIVSTPENRKRRAASGWKGVGTAFLVATILDAVVQYLVLHTVHPGAAVIVGVGLMGLPYSIARGVSNRIASRLPSFRRKGTDAEAGATTAQRQPRA